MHLPGEQREIKKSHDAGQTMHADLRVRPVIHRLPADELRALCLTEGRLDLIAVPIGQNDLIRAPFRMIGKNDVLSEPASVIPQHLGIRPNRHPVLFFERDVNVEDRGDVAFGQNVIDFALDRVQRCPAVGLSQIPAEFLELGLRLPDRPAQPVDLLAIGPGIVGHDDRPFPAIKLERRPVGLKGLVLLVCSSDSLVILERNPAEIGMMVRRESPDKRQPRVGVDPGDVLRRVEAFVEDEGHPRLLQRPQEIPHLGIQLEHELGVVDVGRIRPVEKRDSVLPAAKKRQPDMAELVLPGLGMRVTGQRGGRFRTHLREEVRRVIEKTVQGDVGNRDDLAGHFVPDRRHVLGLDFLHLVPEVGRVESRPVDVPVFSNRRPFEPAGQGGFAFGLDHPVEDDKIKILADAHALVAFRHDPVDDVDKTDLLLETLHRRHGSELEGFDLGDFGALEALLDPFRGAEVLLPDDAGFALDALGFGQIIVGTTLDPFFEEIRHTLTLSY